MEDHAFNAIETDGFVNLIFGLSCFYWLSGSDGRISASELGRVLGAAGVELSETQLTWILDKIDKDGSGSVDKEELRALIKIAKMLFSKVFSFMSDHDEEQVRSVLVSHDAEGSGSITKEELPNVLRELNPDIDDSEVSAKWT